MSERERRFTPTTLFITGALLIWMADFIAVYVFAALACARGFADVRVVGMPIVPFVAMLLSVAAGVTTAVLLRSALKIMRDSRSSEHSRFLGFVAVTTSVLAMIALVLLSLPPLVVSACTR
jgi:ascorbate-specific PTS system EIIC-type component UlaA